MPPKAKLFVVGALAFMAGVLGGGIGGFEVGVRVMQRLLSSGVTATGNQAHVVLTLLDRREEGRLRDLMESEIDSCLQTLSEVETREGFSAGAPQKVLYERLKQYRLGHPSRAASRSE